MSKGQRQRLNQTVRAHCPGGGLTLDALNLMQKVVERQDPDTEAGSIARLAYKMLNNIADEMRDQALIWIKEDKSS